MKLYFLYMIVVAIVLEVSADMLFKYWSINSRTVLLCAGVVLYSLGTIAWAYSLRFEQLSRAVTIFTVVNLIMVVLAGILIFHEHVSFTNKIGILLGVASVILMQI